MNDYHDRYGEPLRMGDTVAALRGSEEDGYTAALYIVGIPNGHHTLMLRITYPHLSCAEVYTYIPTDMAELQRRRLTRLGPHLRIDRMTFEQWRCEVVKLPGVDSKQVQQLRFVTNGSY